MKKENRTSRPVSSNRGKDDALIVKTDESKYLEILKAMRGNAQLMDLGADVRCIRPVPSTSEMILELKKKHDALGSYLQVYGQGR